MLIRIDMKVTEKIIKKPLKVFTTTLTVQDMKVIFRKTKKMDKEPIFSTQEMFMKDSG